MKTQSHPSLAAIAWLFFATLLPGVLHAQQADMVPNLAITEGLPGSQVSLTWQAEPGARYAIEKSPDLSPGSWKRLALVEPSQALATWLDPETTTERYFYRVTIPQAEVYAIDFPVLTSAGGIFVVQAQSLPPGSSLMVQAEGGATHFFVLMPQGDGTWHADVTGTFPLGDALTARVQSGGQSLGPAIHPVVTRNGLMPDGPASLPPAAPVPAAYGGQNPLYEGQQTSNNSPIHEESTVGGASALYQGSRDAGATSNPHFVPNEMTGEMPVADFSTHSPLNGGLPGEAGFHACDLALVTPAGPALAWVRTYRSKGGNSPNGTTFSYDIAIEPVPAALGAAAPRIKIHDGGGRIDTFHRQPDGTYTCDGLFREGRFDGETFTLTFFDQGRWVFHPLDGSPGAGKIASIIDVHGNAVSCTHDEAGRLIHVSSSFGQSLSVVHDAEGRISTVTDHTGRFVTYSYFQQGETGGPAGAVKSVSCPIIPGQPPVCGPTTYTYTTGQAHPGLDGNLLTIRDGAGRLMEGFTYSTQSDPGEVDFDTVATHDAHRTDPASDAVCVLNLVRLPAGVAPRGGYTAFHNDEVGRLTEVVFDPLHRPVSVKQFPPFAPPGQDSDATTNRPTGKLRPTDPEFFETTASYNIDGMLRRCTLPDGSQIAAVFERDLNPACPARERGNARTHTIRSSGGDERTVSCEYLPGFGTPESARPGNPIHGLIIKGGRNPGDGIVEAATNRSGAGPIYVLSPPDPDMAAGVVNGISSSSQAGPIYVLSPPNLTRLTTAHGQNFSWTHDDHGRVLSHSTPVAGQGFTATYDLQGRCISRTILDGDGPGFRTDFHYHATTGFLLRVVVDPNGLAITESRDCDDLGRSIRHTDPRGHSWLVEYNALDLPTRINSPPAQGGISISTRLYYDGGGGLICGETDHFLSDGSPVQENAGYSTVLVRDSRGRVSRIAVEERPVDFDPSGDIDLAAIGIENFAVLDVSYGPDGRCVRLITPAASREAAEDAVCDFSYDERGLLHRVIDGGVGSPASVTTECDYTVAGQIARRAIVARVLPTSEVHFDYDGFHRLASFTDAMGNQKAFDYSRRGHVTVSLFGEVDDVPGGADNVLLARQRVRFGQALSGSSAPAWSGSKKGYDHYTAKSDMSAGTRSAGKKGYDYYQSSSSMGAASLPGPGHWLTPLPSPCLMTAPPLSGPAGDCDKDPPFVALTLSGVGDAIYDIDGGATSSALTLPGVDDVVWDIKVSASSSGSQFHGWFVADDTLEAERFAPGDLAPHPVEVTTVTRSPAGLPLHVSRNGDSLATLEYDTAGRPVRCSNAACHVEVVRDGSGDVTSLTRTDFSTETDTPAKSFTTSRVIDALGRTTSLTDGVGNSAFFAYDSLHRITSFTDPDGMVLTALYDGVSTGGSPYSVRFDADADGDGIPDFLGSVYVRCGELRASTCASGYARVHSHDSLGRSSRCDFPDGTFETHAYDAKGFLSVIRHRDGTLAGLTHDLRGRLISESITGGPAGLPAAPDRHITYDGRGFVSQIVEGSSVCGWTHDSLGNVLTETQSGAGIVHTYDHRGRTGYATSVQGPFRVSIAETRDAFGRVTAVTARDDAGQLVSPPVATMQYLGMRVSRCDTANGVSTAHTYRGDEDPALPGTSNFGFDRCVATESTHQGKAVFASKKGYDYYQNASSIRATHRDGSSRTHTYGRDPLGRIISSQIVFDAGDGILQTEHDVAYTVNARGDRLTASGGVNPGTYSQSEILPPGDAQRARYTSWPRGLVEWDANGNLKQFPTADTLYQYQQDTRGRLVSVTNGNTGEMIAEFSYDGCDRLVQRVLHSNDGLPPTATRFLYDGDVCIHEIDVSSGLPTQSHLVCDGTHFRTMTSSGDLVFVHRASSGGDISYVAPCDASCITDASGTPIEIIASNDAGLPLFYDADGRSSSTALSATGLSWLRPGALWMPSVRLHLHGGGASSPDLGMPISSGKWYPRDGHVTVIK